MLNSLNADAAPELMAFPQSPEAQRASPQPGDTYLAPQPPEDHPMPLSLPRRGDRRPRFNPQLLVRRRQDNTFHEIHHPKNTVRGLIVKKEAGRKGLHGQDLPREGPSQILAPGRVCSRLPGARGIGAAQWMPPQLSSLPELTWLSAVVASF